jgi:hypothetical protein
VQLVEAIGQVKIGVTPGSKQAVQETSITWSVGV